MYALNLTFDFTFLFCRLGYLLQKHLPEKVNTNIKRQNPPKLPCTKIYSPKSGNISFGSCCFSHHTCHGTPIPPQPKCMTNINSVKIDPSLEMMREWGIPGKKTVHLIRNSIRWKKILIFFKKNRRLRNSCKTEQLLHARKEQPVAMRVVSLTGRGVSTPSWGWWRWCWWWWRWWWWWKITRFWSAHTPVILCLLLQQWRRPGDRFSPVLYQVVIKFSIFQMSHIFGTWCPMNSKN